MKLDAFVKMLVKATEHLSAQDRKDDLATKNTQGIGCQLCLTANGHVTSKQTAITVSLVVPPKI